MQPIAIGECLVVLLVLAGVAPTLHRWLPKFAGGLLALGPATVFCYLLSWVPVIETGNVGVQSMSWFPQLGVSLDFSIDGLSLLMGLLICGIGALIFLYAQGYLKGHVLQGKFFCFLMIFLAAMLGVVTADNLILLFVFWELTSISSYLLIGFYHESDEARWKALQALLVTGLGGVAMLAGFILLGIVSDTWSIAEIAQGHVEVTDHALFPAILTLVLLGAFTKSAQWPFHFWLPNAMAGPAPVSAFLHSATMVKAGVFLLAKMNPILGDSMLWTIALSCAGMITMLVGTVNGLLQTDVKTILAYTTLSVLGVLVMLLGVGTDLALQSALLFLLGHALYKATLFMCVGSIDHETGTRDVRVLSGLRFAMPATAFAACLAALSMAGVPPLFGFLGKEYVYKTGTYLDEWSWIVLTVAMATNIMMMALAFKVGLHPFWGKRTAKALPKIPHEAPWSMLVGPVVLALLGVLLGLFPGTLATPLIAPAVSAIAGYSMAINLSLWHGLNVPLLLSVLTLVGGYTLYALRRKLWKRVGDMAELRYTFDSLYGKIFNSFIAIAGWQTRVLQSGYLRRYLLIILSSTAFLLASQLFMFGGMPTELGLGSAGILDWTIAALILTCLLVIVRTHSRMVAIIVMGVVGFGVALVFILYGAPDLAITQILVETLTVVLFMFVIYRLPAFRELSKKRTKFFDACFSLGVGFVITLLVLQAQYIDLAPSIAGQYGEWSYALAKGKNVVNVILVDFRALDTLGEITVLVIAAIGIFVLIRDGMNKKKDSNHPESSQELECRSQEK